MASDNAEKIANGEKKIVRNLAHFSPDLWGDIFTSFVLDKEVMDGYNSEIDVLKEEVRAMLVAVAAGTTTTTLAQQMNLIDKVERLGLSYHFENEIEQQVENLFADYKDKSNNVKDYDLFTVSLHFRIFRQHGHRMSPSVFSKFMDEQSKFMKSVSSDVLGMLSLYEAAHLRIPGEDILDEAFYFTKKHLNELSEGKLIENTLLADQVKHALAQPLHRCLPRVEAKYYISIYRQVETRNDTLLRFAKLDFNRLQLLYKKEIGEVTRWWKKVRAVAEVTHVRDRPVEGYFWCAGIFDAPEFALARILLTKVFITLAIIDDTYDAYGTFEELQPFTQAWLSWDAQAVDLLPDYMKPIYTTVRAVYAEFEAELALQGRAYGVDYAIRELQQTVKCYDVETKWLKEGYVPKFDEYMVNEIPNCMDPMHTSAVIGMGEYATIEGFEWVWRKPKLVYASSYLIRLLDDIGGHKHEHERKHIPTAPDCYMKEYKVSEQEAKEVMYQMVEDQWKDFNEEMLRPTPMPRHFLMPILNLLRNANVVYQGESDGFTKPERSEHLIRALYVDPIPM